MKKVGFVGAYDKTDLIINIAKILVELNKKVLVIDATINQKSKYIVPSINPTKTYITEFEGIDIAVGFSEYEHILQYLGNEELDYEYILIDTDSEDSIKKFELQLSFKNYFVTSFDNYSLKKGLEILSGLKEVMSMTKILYSEEVLREEDDYLNFLALGKKILWSEFRIYFPIENGDLTAIYENHRLARISLKKISLQYKEGLEYIVGELASNVSSGNIKRIIKEL